MNINCKKQGEFIRIILLHLGHNVLVKKIYKKKEKSSCQFQVILTTMSRKLEKKIIIIHKIKMSRETEQIFHLTIIENFKNLKTKIVHFFKQNLTDAVNL